MSATPFPAGPFAVSADGFGELSRAQCRHPRFDRPSRGLRVPSGHDSLAERSRAVVLVSRDDAVLWGPSAAVLLDLPLPPWLESAQVHVMVPAEQARPRRVGVRARQADFVLQETTIAAGVRVTSPARTFVDLAALLALPDLVADGLPMPEVNGVITDDDGQFLARCDLAYRELRIVIEYDGAVHASREMRHGAI